MKNIAYVGLDVHQDFIVVAMLAEGSERLLDERKIINDRVKLVKYLKKYRRDYELRCCYEASGCGYVAYRWLREEGIECEVIAPSLIPKRAGERIKTDRRDAEKLARLFRAGELVSVNIPTEKEEVIRGLVRCRETLKREVIKSRHYVLKFLQAKGLVYRGGSNWTGKHWNYLRQLKFEGAEDITYRQYINLLEYKLTQLKELDRQIEEIAFTDEYRGKVSRLRCLRGIDTLTAMVLISEINDFNRFSRPGELMSYLGLIPSESSSGNVRRQGRITKAGNVRCRRILIEAAWHYQHKPAMSGIIRKRQIGQPLEIVKHCWQAQQRLHKKFWRIAIRKERNKAVVAVARELVGFIWAIMTGRIDREKGIELTVA